MIFRLSILLTFIGLLIYALPARAADLDASRTLLLEGPVSSESIAPLKLKLEEITTLALTGNKKDVTLIINSPGGEVISGGSFINRLNGIKSLGIRVNCYVTDMAASMAFQIFTQCSVRYALSGSYLLWHGVRVHTQEPITSKSAYTLADALGRIDRLIFNQLDSTLRMDSDEIQYHFDNETLWTGIDLASVTPSFLVVRNAYPEVTKAIADGKITKSAVPTFRFFGVKGVQFISIWSRYSNILGD